LDDWTQTLGTAPLLAIAALLVFGIGALL